jgi:hypothetical protein
MNKQPGAQFEILVDGKPRSYRDRKDFAMDAARLIKSKNTVVSQFELSALS